MLKKEMRKELRKCRELMVLAGEKGDGTEVNRRAEQILWYLRGITAAGALTVLGEHQLYQWLQYWHKNSMSMVAAFVGDQYEDRIRQTAVAESKKYTVNQLIERFKTGTFSTIERGLE